MVCTGGHTTPIIGIVPQPQETRVGPSWIQICTPAFLRAEQSWSTHCDSTARCSFDCPLNDIKKSHRKRFIPGPASSGAPPRKGVRNWPLDVCAEFNAWGSCSFEERCKFRHVCNDCSRNHPAKLCPHKLLQCHVVTALLCIAISTRLSC